MRVQRILYPVDFSEATDAGLAPALSLATEFGAELLLLHVLNFPYPYVDPSTPAFDFEGYYREMEQEAREQMDRLVDEDTRAFLRVRSTVLRGTPAHEILDTAQSQQVDLIVMPTHGRRGLDRVLFGSTTEKIVRMAPCPVLTVSPRRQPAAFRPERIVLPTDFSAHAEPALEAALELARRYGATLTMLHVVTLWESDPANPAWRFPAIPDEYRKAMIDAAEKQLVGQRQRGEQQGVRIETMLARGFDPAAEIVRTAREDVHADLIVMGTHGHTGLTHLLLGSVAEKVVRTFDGAVLTVRMRREG